MKVVCGVILQKNKILIGQRSALKDPLGYWEFIGGKVEKGETLETALSRELFEELAIKPSSLSHFVDLGKISYQSFELHFLAVQLNGSYSPLEHKALAWTRFADLSKFIFCPGDQKALVQFGTKISQLIKNPA